MRKILGVSGTEMQLDYPTGPGQTSDRGTTFLTTCAEGTFGPGKIKIMGRSNKSTCRVSPGCLPSLSVPGEKMEI